MEKNNYKNIINIFIDRVGESSKFSEKKCEDFNIKILKNDQKKYKSVTKEFYKINGKPSKNRLPRNLKVNI